MLTSIPNITLSIDDIGYRYKDLVGDIPIDPTTRVTLIADSPITGRSVVSSYIDVTGVLHYLHYCDENISDCTWILQYHGSEICIRVAG